MYEEDKPNCFKRIQHCALWSKSEARRFCSLQNTHIADKHSFTENESLKLDISGIYREREKLDLPFGSTDTVNKGSLTIHTGGKFDSYLQILAAPTC